MKWIKKIAERLLQLVRKEKIDSSDMETEVKNSIPLKEAYRLWKEQNGS